MLLLLFPSYYIQNTGIKYVPSNVLYVDDSLTDAAVANLLCCGDRIIPKSTLYGLVYEEALQYVTFFLEDAGKY
jgi:hypothetical protein